MTLLDALQTVSPNDYVIVAWLNGETNDKVCNIRYHRPELHNMNVVHMFVDDNKLGFYVSSKESQLWKSI